MKDHHRKLLMSHSCCDDVLDNWPYSFRRQRRRRRWQCSLIHLPSVCPSDHSSCASLVAGRFAFSICLPTHLPFVFGSSSSSRRRIFQFADRPLQLIIYSLIHRRHDRLGGGHVGGRKRLRFIAVGHRVRLRRRLTARRQAGGWNCRAKAAGYDHRRDNLSRRPSDSDGRLSSKVEMRQCDNVVVYRGGAAGRPTARCNDRQRRS